MSTIRRAKRLASAATDISGVKKTDGFKFVVAYGQIPAGSYASGDTIKFSDIAAKVLIKAEFTPTSGTNVIVHNSASLASAIVVPTYGTPAIDYKIEYQKGAGINLAITPTTLS